MKKFFLICISAILLFAHTGCELMPYVIVSPEEEVADVLSEEVELEDSEAIEMPSPTAIEIPAEIPEPPPAATEFTSIPFEPTPSTPDPDNLVKNGYFLEDFDYWKRVLVDEGGSSKTNIVSFSSSDFGRALHLDHEGLGHVQFYQTIPISNLDLEFSATFQTFSTEGLIMGFSGSGYAMIGIIYLDAEEEMLGVTRIINFNESLFAGTAFVGAPDKLSDTNTVHNLTIESNEVYKTFSIDIKKEINNNLLGINSEEIRFIQIAFVAGSTDRNAGADLYVSEIELKQK